MEVPCAIKKKPGKLVHDSKEVRWLPSAGGEPEVVGLDGIQGMQATPPTAAKLRIKLTAKDGRALMLEFAAVADLEKARNELQQAIKSHRESSQTPAAVSAGSSGSAGSAGDSASGATSGAASGAASGSATPNQAPKPAGTAKKSTKKLSLDPQKLLQNLDLQRHLLRQDPELMQTFQQVVISSGALTNEQFWSLRMHLLVTAAQQQMQIRGSYNVLSTIKPTTGSDNKVNINLTREKIADVLDQYPLVRKAYNDNVPKLSEGEFWQRFFMSKLFLVLRGEKVAPNHPPDATFDPYIDVLYDLQEKQRARRSLEDSEHPAPLFINVEANAENNPETYGNNIITTAGKGTRGLIRSMNGLSHRLLLGKRKQRDVEDTPQQLGATEMDLRLNDLAEEPNRDNEIDLHLQLEPVTPQNMSREHIVALVEQMGNSAPQKISLDETLDSILDGSSQTESLILSLTPNALASSMAQDTPVSGEVQLTQTTSIEFLRHFWNAYTKNPSEAAPLREYLTKSKDRIDALNDDVSRGALKPVYESLDRALNMPLSS